MFNQKGYEWLNSYTSSARFWEEDILTWEDSINFATEDYTLYSLLTLPFIADTYISVMSFSKLSFLDITVLSESSNDLEIRELYDALMWDFCTIVQLVYYPSHFIYYTNYQDFITVLVHNSPELTTPLLEFIETYSKYSVFHYTRFFVSKVFTESIKIGMHSIGSLAITASILTWSLVLFFHALRVTKLDNVLDSHWTRTSLYTYSASRENRLQLEALFVTISLFTFSFVFGILTFDDLFAESVERLNCWLFYTFLIVYIFFLYKNSIHYFSFLEASVSGGTFASTLAQFSKDVANHAVLLLRFMALLVRLNIYDALDDVLDSNYIFVCDFYDECSSATQWIRLEDLHDLTSRFNFINTTLLQYLFDIIFIPFLVLAYSGFLLLSYVFFILEECIRVLLAFFIMYLVIFEMQSINRSYTEDSYFSKQRRA